MNYKRKPVKSFRLHPTLLEQLKKVAKEEGLTQTAFLERALYREIFRYEQEQKQAA